MESIFPGSSARHIPAEAASACANTARAPINPRESFFKDGPIIFWIRVSEEVVGREWGVVMAVARHWDALMWFCSMYPR